MIFFCDKKNIPSNIMQKIDKNVNTFKKNDGRRPPIKYIRKKIILKEREKEKKMIEHLRKIQCQCGNTFEIFGNEQYKCPCEKTWITNNDYGLLSYRNTDGYGHNFEVISDEKFISDDCGLIDVDVIKLYETCREKAKNIGFSWFESTTKNRQTNQEIITYINATYEISLKNEIENNVIEFCITINENKHDEYLKRFNNLLIVLNELEKNELDFSDRACKRNDHKNAFQKMKDKYKDFNFDAAEEKLEYKDIKFYI